MPTIAYLGPEHTNTHLAALKRFGRRSRYMHAPTIEDVFRLVERHKATYGVVPIENSLQGAVTFTLDWFIQSRGSSITIQGDIELPIRHFLITLGLTKPRQIAAIKGVFSHPQVLSQCDEWLRKHMPHAIRQETNSTSEAVWTVMRVGGAAIGTREVARQYGLAAVPIPMSRNNKTRFLIIGLGDAQRGRTNKTSILFALKDKPGALHDALVPFKYHHINLTKIESRPSKRKAWEYLFFIDFEGHKSEPRVKRTLKALEKSTTFLRILGSYPTRKSSS